MSNETLDRSNLDKFSFAEENIATHVPEAQNSLTAKQYEASKPKSLIEQRAELERVTAETIKALLQERGDILTAYNLRDKQIGEELKALGYKRPRAAKVEAGS